MILRFVVAYRKGVSTFVMPAIARNPYALSVAMSGRRSMAHKHTTRAKALFQCAYCGEVLRGAKQRDYHERAHKRYRDDLPGLKVPEESADNEHAEPPSLW